MSVSNTVENKTDERSSLRLKILVLPDFHQTTKHLKHNAKKLFINLQSLATFHFANSSQLYKRSTNTNQLSVSLQHIDQLFKSFGPFDGLIGFAEGASLGGILSALQPRGNISFNFVILFSGLSSREKSIKNVFSLHIYGNKDDSVNNNRAIELAAAFDHSIVVEHPGSRFTPKTWPNDTIKQFLLEQYGKLFDGMEMRMNLDSLLTWKEKMEAMIEFHQKRNRMKVPVIPLGLSDFTDKYSLADVMVFIWAERTTFYQSEPKSDINRILPFFQHWIELYLKKPDEVLSLYLDTIPKYGGWRDVKTIYLYAQKMKDRFVNERILLENLQRACVKMIANQLKEDYQVALQGLNGIQNSLSHCAKEMPQISNNSNELLTVLAKEVAEYLDQPLNVSKAHAYQSLIGTIRRQLKTSSMVFLEEQLRWKDRPLFCTRQQVLAAPPPSTIVHPQPQPIVLSPLEELQPLLEYLTANKPPPSDEQQSIVFPRGTLMTGGRLDLCKQAVGPLGVQPLLNAMQHSSSVTRLLLGNNIVGRAGAEAISQYIRLNSNSTIDTWYIACNRFDSDCISLICDALATDTKVKSLWLKRNPILPAGSIHIARMLTSNTHLQTLDLLNTGLLDEGCQILFTALKINRSLKHLYIDSNGLTPKSAVIIRTHFEQNDNQLETLYLSCNLLGDEGTGEIAEGLKYDRCLRRLSLASNSLGVDGMRELVDALVSHPKVQELNLGFMKSTTLMGGMNNNIGDEGAAEVSRLIQFNQHIRSIDLTRNGISQRGLIQLRDALKTNRTLTTLKGLPSKQRDDRTIKKEIGMILKNNVIQWGKEVLGLTSDDRAAMTIDDCWKKGQELVHEINYPEHIMEVISYYRIQ